MHDTHEHKHEHIDPNKKTLELLKKKKEEEAKKNAAIKSNIKTGE